MSVWREKKFIGKISFFI